jgi:hypothetical protein
MCAPQRTARHVKSQSYLLFFFFFFFLTLQVHQILVKFTERKNCALIWWGHYLLHVLWGSQMIFEKEIFLHNKRKFHFLFFIRECCYSTAAAVLAGPPP